jgi:hypothetical protein
MGSHEIPSPYLIRALARRKPEHHCENCGARMFVRYESGLCPFCLSGRPPRRSHRRSDAALPTPFAPPLERSSRRAVIRRWLGGTLRRPAGARPGVSEAPIPDAGVTSPSPS